MKAPATSNSFNSDVLHSENHYRLSQEEVAKAVRRHQREHPSACIMNPAANPTKTAAEARDGRHTSPDLSKLGLR